jgi:predicted Zn-dependent protease
VFGLNVAVVPVGKLETAEIEGAAARVAKVLRRPLEIREGFAVPRGAEDTERGQHRAATLLELLRMSSVQTRPGRLIGAEGTELKTPGRPEAWIFVTDADLFTVKTDGVFAALVSAKSISVISVKRLREAFYRRKADPGRQRARLVKEMLRMAGRLVGLPECTNPECALAPSKSIADVDAKTESYCRACSQRLFEGTIRV